MEEIKIYEEPLSKEEFTKHSINGSITSSPSKYHLIDIIKNLIQRNIKHRKPVEMRDGGLVMGSSILYLYLVI